MRDLFAWSIPLGRWFGILVKLHILFPFIALGRILHVALYTVDGRPAWPEGAWIDVSILIAIAFASVLWHEYAHCFSAQLLGGDATEILMWPLGGLASVDLPHRPRAHFLCAAAGPASNLVVAGFAIIFLQFMGEHGYRPSFNPFVRYPIRNFDGLVALQNWSGDATLLGPYSLPVLTIRFFYVNYLLALFNIALVGFPMDGGRMLQSLLWPHFGYRQATSYAVFAGFTTALLVGLYGLIYDEMLAMGLALFIWFTCHTQWIILETGGEESLFGYDFSQGYTSLERDLPATPKLRRQSWWQRWKQQRTAKRVQREEENRAYEENRMDELLEKVQREGITALTDEERRFMKRVSDRYKNRH